MSYLYKGAEWDLELLEKIWEQIDIIGKEYELDYYTPSIEIVSFDQMIANCSTSAMPSLFDHWTFGKDEVITLENYKKTGSGLAFEVVINTDPAIAYCQENNSTTMQTLVMAHAICGHSSFFKNNYMFKQFTQANKILPYITSYKKFLKRCEERYGMKRVEYLLDACITLQLHAFDSCPKKEKTSEENWKQMLERIEYNETRDAEMDTAMPDTVKRNLKVVDKETVDMLYSDSYYKPSENILKMIGLYSPKLQKWQRKVIEGFCYIQQYFYPQYLTKVMNEGWASFWHYTILQTMHERGLIDDASWLETIDSHSMVLYQHPMTPSLNPYTLGFNMFMDIKEKAGDNWRNEIQWAMENYNDSSFVMQYLSPEVIKKMKLMRLDYKHEDIYQHVLEVKATADEKDIDLVKEELARQYEMDSIRPRLMGHVVKQNHTPHLKIKAPAGTNIGDLQHTLDHLWGRDINEIIVENENG